MPGGESRANAEGGATRHLVDNTIQAPTRIAPVNSALEINSERLPYVVPPYSIQVLRI
jgi:hypothetical protein